MPPLGVTLFIERLSVGLVSCADWFHWRRMGYASLMSHSYNSERILSLQAVTAAE